MFVSAIGLDQPSAAMRPFAARQARVARSSDDVMTFGLLAAAAAFAADSVARGMSAGEMAAGELADARGLRDEEAVALEFAEVDPMSADIDELIIAGHASTIVFDAMIADAVDTVAWIDAPAAIADVPAEDGFLFG